MQDLGSGEATCRPVHSRLRFTLTKGVGMFDSGVVLLGQEALVLQTKCFDELSVTKECGIGATQRNRKAPTADALRSGVAGAVKIQVIHRERVPSRV